MILAAAQYGKRSKGASPPDALMLALRCRQWGALPLGGGMLEQPDWLIEQMSRTLNTYDAWRGYADKPIHVSDVKFAELNPVAWRIVMATEKLRLLQKGVRTPDDFDEECYE